MHNNTLLHGNAIFYLAGKSIIPSNDVYKIALPCKRVYIINMHNYKYHIAVSYCTIFTVVLSPLSLCGVVCTINTITR